MCSIVHEFYIGLAAQSAKDSSSCRQKLKLIEEGWRQKSKRGQGHYTKAPDDNVMVAMTSKLLAPAPEQINEGLSLPSLKPSWLDVAVGILFSIESIRHRMISLTHSSSCSTEEKVVEFMRQYILTMNADIMKNKKTRRKITDKFTIDFPMSTDISNNPQEQLSFILDTLILPIANSCLEAIKTFTCIKCKTVMRTHFSITIPIPLNIFQNTINLERQVASFFSDTTSDQICSSCSVPLIRRISVVHWPDVLLFTINSSQTLSARSQKAPQGMNLEQFNEPINIGSPATTIYDLPSFIAIHKFNNHDELVRVTKIKNKWLSSINQKLIGEGEHFPSLYANSRK
ncbi:unnamed protein product [Adineta steineri]|uniref:Uncharacterized protein n=1 Tax=Adineta steineri TaxID=433720 RepID=A0A815SXQ3_9BILA|nr:unnamed protein product [Adineta steineri]CAF4180202.1 unnamed protein product [Adineta steineri]